MKDLLNTFGITAVAALVAIGLFVFALIRTSAFQEQEFAVDYVVPDYYPPPIEHPGRDVFKAYCKTCHSLDRKLIGPLLVRSFTTRDSLCFVKMIIDANKLIRSGDTAAVKVFNDYNQFPHPDFKGLSENEMTKLLEPEFRSATGRGILLSLAEVKRMLIKLM